MSEKVNWEKTEELGFKKNIINPLLQGLKEALTHEKEELEIKIKNLKMLGVIVMDQKLSMDEINKKIKDLDITK